MPSDRNRKGESFVKKLVKGIKVESTEDTKRKRGKEKLEKLTEMYQKYDLIETGRKVACNFFVGTYEGSETEDTTDCFSGIVGQNRELVKALVAAAEADPDGMGDVIRKAALIISLKGAVGGMLGGIDLD